MTELSNKSTTAINKNTAFWLFLFLYTAFVIYLCYQLNIWVDEAYTLDTSSYNLKGVISQSYNFEGQPPAYFVFLSLWRSFNSGIFFARLFSVVSIGVAAWAFYRLVVLISGSKNSLWLVVLFLLNPYTVWASTQARLYAFLLMLSVVTIYFFFCFYLKNKNKYLLFLGITAIVGIYTQYLFVFLLLGLGVAVLLFLGWKLFLKFCIYLVPAALVFLQNILFTTSPVKLAYVGSIKESFVTKMVGVFHTPQNLMLSLDLLPFGRMVRWAVIAVFVGAMGFAYIKLYIENRSINKRYLNTINSVLISGALLLLCIALLFAKTGIDYNDRYLTVGFPLIVLLWLVLNVYTPAKRLIIVAAFAGYYILINAVNYKNPVNDFDSRALASYVTRIEKPNEPVLFYPKVLVLPFQYYYKGKNTLAPLPDNVKFDSTYISKIQDTVQLQQAIAHAGNSAGSYILITNRNDSRFENEDDVKLLQAYIPAHYIVTSDTFFNGKYNPLRIRRLSKK